MCEGSVASVAIDLESRGARHCYRRLAKGVGFQALRRTTSGSLERTLNARRAFKPLVKL